MRHATDILLDELETTLVQRRAVAIDGFGTFELRGTTPARVLFDATPAVRGALERGPRATSLHAACPTLTARAARRACSTVGRMERRLVELVDDALRALRATGLPTPLGRLGVLRAHRASTPDTPLLAFTPSRHLIARIDGAPPPATVEPQAVAAVLAQRPPLDAATVEAALARLGFRRDAAATAAAARIAELSPCPPPPLLGVVAGHRVDLHRRPPPCLGVAARVIDRPRAFADASEAHARVAAAAREPAGVPFARAADGDLWCYCACPGARASCVFRVGAGSRPPYHRHDAPFAGWLAACLLVDELDRVAGLRVLDADDVRRASARVLALVRSRSIAAALCAHLPF